MTHAEHHRHEHGPADQAELLDLDADVLAGHTASIVASLPVEADPRTIVDLGCGTGTGALALLRRFPNARVTAVDSSPAHLDRLRHKAADEGVAEHVDIVEADLDAPEWPDLGTPELVWASASLHHFGDPDRALRQVHELLAPGGLLAVVELAGFPRFLPSGAPDERPGLEERLHTALDHRHAEHVPHRGADWGSRLTEAGFTVEGEQTLDVFIAGAGDETVGRYAIAGLARTREAAADLLTAEDLAALDSLLDVRGPGSILRRGDLVVRTQRSVWTARRN
ncbi:class I SAM-dependent methyltransferase [Phytomonospora sp. NPDC050363]|uniref:class I SAM-dependent methyltransferase n=1 Tax=Phytomonospora sp. NPDC050363 TaxID=3155642 RepID=UPI0033D10899